ncbi:hypothetical protein O7635_19710 [Asanoa sp. WMMD1127]|uniref:hypothetical protein n=1 Tax=Asanoa sp. WMMD1127 TaxID=3016107 RepID=UPI002415FB0F|nr:hypothetical protein [Asanoa sp. WMMD1127]MDG4824085.1 hypothetical protein [Asanoa sp. WMMD1127]
MNDVRAGMAVIDISGVFVGIVDGVFDPEGDGGGSRQGRGMLLSAWQGGRKGWRWIPLAAVLRVVDHAARLSVTESLLCPFVTDGQALRTAMLADWGPAFPPAEA